MGLVSALLKLFLVFVVIVVIAAAFFWIAMVILGLIWSLMLFIFSIFGYIVALGIGYIIGRLHERGKKDSFKL